MKNNPIRALGLLGLVGLAGIFTGNAGFFGFFGFFSFFGLGKNRASSKQAMERAGLNAFIVSTAGMAAAITAIAITGSMKMGALMFALVYFIQILTFALSLIGCEKGKNGERCDEDENI